MKVLLGVDLGTSAFKAIALSPRGDVLARARVTTAYRRPAPDRVQFSAEDHFGRLCRLLRDVAGSLPAGAEVGALCLSGANGNTLLLDENHRPLGPAISWLDTRAGDDYLSLLPGLTREEVRETVGWSWTRRFPLSELAWLRRHRPSLYRKTRYVALDTAFYHRELTGRFAIDHSSATTSFLQDQKTRQWHEPFLRALGLEAAMLPDLLAPGARLGTLLPAAAEATGLRPGVPVVAGSFDHPSAAFGAGILNAGELLLSCGTSWVGFFPATDRAAALAAGLIVDPFLQPHGPWGAMFALTAVGTTIDRYLTEIFPLPKSLSLAARYERFSTSAATVRPGEEGPPIDPLAPVPSGDDERSRLCAGASPGHLSRRLMVGTALGMRRRLAALAEKGFAPRRIVLVGGPSNSAVWTQIVADALDRELYLAGAVMAGATGAAMLGGVGIGLFSNIADAVNQIRPPLTVVRPQPSARAWYLKFE